MSNIPKKGEQANDDQQQEAKRQQKIKSDITTYTDQIVAAMGKNKTSINLQLGFPEPEAQEQIKRDFATQGWALEFKQARTGGNISWS